MDVLLAVPILGGLLMIQVGVLSHVPLLQGTADLLLVALVAWALQKRVRTAWQWAIIGGLMISYVSALPIGAYFIGYLAAVGLSLLLKQRIWQLPILAMLIATFFGTMLAQLIAIIALRLAGTPLPFFDAINLVTLPSVLLNLVLAVPFYALFGDLAYYLYPEEIEV
jgi:rod shape-determining protein MreD